MTDLELERRALWCAQLRDYPTVTLSPPNEWHYFDVLPTEGQAQQWAQGKELARATLRLARRGEAVDTVTPFVVLSAAFDHLGDPDLSLIARAFIDEVLCAASSSRDRCHDSTSLRLLRAASGRR
jgi:hypothetical protein